MPRQEFKESTINDQAYILKFSNSPNYYLRLKGRGGKDTSLETDDLELAREKAVVTYFDVTQNPVQKRQRNFLFKTACEKWLDSKQERVDIGRIRQRSHDTYRGRIYERIIPFANATGIKKVDDINRKSWRDKYFAFYRKVNTKGKWDTPTEGLEVATINSDISTIKELLRWMIDEEIINAGNVLLPEQEPDLKNYRVKANPAFFPETWDDFTKAFLKWEQTARDGTDRKCSWDNFNDEEWAWKKTWLVNYVMFQYCLGSRPHETQQIHLRDLSFQTDSNGLKNGIVNILPETKTGKRISIMDGHTLQKVKDHLEKGIKIRNRQIASFNKMVEEKLNDMSTEKLCKRFKRINPDTRRWELISAVNSDDLLMSNPFRKPSDPLMLSAGTIAKWYKEVLAMCNFPEHYTIYSLRSTHITHNFQMALRNGRTLGSIATLIADNCGTSEEEIKSTFRRLNNLLDIDLLGFNQYDIAKGLQIPAINDPRVACAYGYEYVNDKKIEIRRAPDGGIIDHRIMHPSEYQDSENA